MRPASSGSSSPTSDARAGASATLILASRSPQRRAILEQLGIRFRVVEVDVAEERHGDPVAVAVENARRKAAAARSQAGQHGAPGSEQETVLGVDTLVALGGRIYGKPADAPAAAEMLSALGGVRHAVVSGLALIAPGEPAVTASATTAVAFRALTAATIDWYLASAEWRGRAGGYAIQGRGAALVRRIEGDYLNVVGLPAATLLDLLPDLLAGS